MRAREVLRWILIAVYSVLWAGGILSRILPNIGHPPWAAPLFLLCAAGIVALGTDLNTILVFAGGGFLAEWIGVHTGFPFGRYTYTAALGPGIGGVPAAIACAWVTLLLFARDLARWITVRRWAGAAVGAAVMTSLDLLVDPVATRVLAYWRWDQPGFFFGVPLVNFAGWFGVSALLLSARPCLVNSGRTAIPIGLSVIVFFGAIAVLG
ncbi:MAG: carotenoid biosynthesis protein [Bryobacteraceae bacterium]